MNVHDVVFWKGYYGKASKTKTLLGLMDTFAGGVRVGPPQASIILLRDVKFTDKRSSTPKLLLLFTAAPALQPETRCSSAAPKKRSPERPQEPHSSPQ